MPHVLLKNKIYYTVSVPHKHMCTVNVPYSVPRQQICTVIWGRGVFWIFFLQGCKSNRKFYRNENRKWHILKGWKTLLTPISII